MGLGNLLRGTTLCVLGLKKGLTTDSKLCAKNLKIQWFIKKSVVVIANSWAGETNLTNTFISVTD